MARILPAAQWFEKPGRWLPAFMLAGVAMVLPSGARASAAAELRIYTWEFFLDPQVLAEFGRIHGVKVRTAYFKSDWERDLRLSAGNRADFDVAVVDAAQVAVYQARGWLEPLSVERVPGLAHVDATWRTVTGAVGAHALPFVWGTLGIAYRADLMRRSPSSWMTLLQPDASLCGKLTVGDDPRELIAIALKASGHSANATEPADYRDAQRLLQEQRRCVLGYRYTGVEPQSDLPTGRAWAAMAYSSDAAWLRVQNPNIRFVVPREGGLIWADYLVVLSSSPRKSLAFKFLEFLCEPAIAARMALYSRAATPNASARALLPAAVREDASIYPPSAALHDSELVGVASPAVMSLRNQIFARIIRPH